MLALHSFLLALSIADRPEAQVSRYPIENLTPSIIVRQPASIEKKSLLHGNMSLPNGQRFVARNTPQRCSPACARAILARQLSASDSRSCEASSNAASEASSRRRIWRN